MATPTPGGGQTSLGMNAKVAGLLCYVPCCIGFIFSIVAAIVEKANRSVRFHAFQSLLFHGVVFVLAVGLQVMQRVLMVMDLGAVSLLLSLVALVIGVGYLGITIFMMVKANGGEEFELPTIGQIARRWV